MQISINRSTGESEQAALDVATLLRYQTERADHFGEDFEQVGTDNARNAAQRHDGW